jgi:hypothetical protein
MIHEVFRDKHVLNFLLSELDAHRALPEKEELNVTDLP